MISHIFILLLKKLHFLKVVVVRFFIIIFRKRKRIEKLYLDYDTKHIFDKSYIVINYRFRNAIYYRFANHITTEKQIKIFNLKNFDKEFKLVVHGFFQKREYELQFKPQLSLNTANFKTNFSNLSFDLIEQELPNLNYPGLQTIINKPSLNIPAIQFRDTLIRISERMFNQTDYI